MYDSDVKDEEWELIKHFFEKKDNRGCKPIHQRRSIVNAIFYITKTGTQWRYLPKDFAPWSTVFDYFSEWKRFGIWEKVNQKLIEIHREKVGKKKDPSYGIIDSQSSKTTLTLDGCGYDGGKKVKGRKRHIVVDTLGNLLAIVVHAANIHDTKSAHLVLSKTYEKYSTIKAFSGDAGYRKTAVEFVKEELGLEMHISEKIKDTFAVLPIRWIVERTFAWIGNYRRLAKDFERLSTTVEAFVTIAMIRVTLRKCV